MGYTALALGQRVGHSAEKITYRYAHLFPSVQQDMAEQLDAENMEEELNEVEGELAKVLNELKSLKKGENVSEDLLEVIQLITVTMDGMKDE